MRVRVPLPVSLKEEYSMELPAGLVPLAFVVGFVGGVWFLGYIIKCVLRGEEI